MKKVVIVHFISFCGILVLLFMLHLRDVFNGFSQRAPFLVELALSSCGFVFLITAGVIWVRAWYKIVKNWSNRSLEQNLLMCVFMVLGNILGGYFVLYRDGV